ncbi:MAG: hypothetical protein ABIT37_12490 [Luteolibacter sp.]
MRKIARMDLLFWVMKICAATLGGTAGEFLSTVTNVGWALRLLVLAAVCLVPLVAQIRAKKFHAGLFWSAVLSAGAAGAAVSDFMARALKSGHVRGQWVLVATLVTVLAVWRMSEKTLSLKRMHRRRAELFFWAAIVVSSALGAAMGPAGVDAGLAGGTVALVGLLMAVVVVFFSTRWSRTVLFWSAFVLTGPLGAISGDLLARPVAHGGLGFGIIGSFSVLACLLAGLIGYTCRKEQGMVACS